MVRGHPPDRALALILPAISILGWAGALQAQSDPPASPPPVNIQDSSPRPYWANRGQWNFGAQLGFGIENTIPHDISHIALLIAQPQVGLIVRDFQARRLPVRRFEIVNEGVFGNALHPGGRLAGYALLFRLDGKNRRREVPFLDFGGGLQRTTLATRAPELNGRTQFSPQVGLGIQHFFNPQRALVLEYRYLHMSNAGLTPPNQGFNANMLTIGFRWLRRPHPPGWRSPANPSRGLLHRLFGAD